MSTRIAGYPRLRGRRGGIRSWPGRAGCNGFPASRKATSVEEALACDLAEHMGPRFNPSRFVPFAVVDEFEALLFSAPAAFSRAIGRPELDSELWSVRDRFDSPEEIDVSPAAVPSKRIEAVRPGYGEPQLGLFAILEIGLRRIRG